MCGTLCEVGDPVKETTDSKHRNGFEAFSARETTGSGVYADGRPARSPPLLAQRSLRRGARCLMTPDLVVPLAHQSALLLPAQRVPVGVVCARVVHLRAIRVDLLGVRPDYLLKLRGVDRCVVRGLLRGAALWGRRRRTRLGIRRRLA